MLGARLSRTSRCQVCVNSSCRGSQQAPRSNQGGLASGDSRREAGFLYLWLAFLKRMHKLQTNRFSRKDVLDIKEHRTIQPQHPLHGNKQSRSFVWHGVPRVPMHVAAILKRGVCLLHCTHLGQRFQKEKRDEQAGAADCWQFCIRRNLSRFNVMLLNGRFGPKCSQQP